VQAPRLLQLDLGGAGRLQAVPGDGGGGEEPERVEVRAAHRVRLDDGVGICLAQPQRQRVPVPVVPVDHRPLVQPEAAGVRRPGRGRREQPGDEGDGSPAVGEERLPVERDRAVVVGGVPAPGRVRRRTVRAGQEGDPCAGVPPAQLRRPRAVVLVEEVLDRVALPGGPAGPVPRGQRVGPLLVRPRQRRPPVGGRRGRVPAGLHHGPVPRLAAPSRAGPVQRLAASLPAVRRTGSSSEGWGGRGPSLVRRTGSVHGGGQGVLRQWALHPPSMTSELPVIEVAAGEQR
jgi:hypothetical protein